MVTDGVGPAVYVLALVNLSINRFLLSALSASLPRTVDGPLLLTANSLTPTLGAAAAGVGGAIGFVLGLVLPAGRGKDAAALFVAAAVMATAAALATRLGKDRLGPDERADARQMRAALGTPRPRPGRRCAAPDRAPDPGPGARDHGRAPVPLRRHVHRQHPHRPQPAVRPGGRRRGPADVRARARRRRRPGSCSPWCSPRCCRRAPARTCGSCSAWRSPRSASCCSSRRPARPRCSSPPARSAWPRRARRSPSTPSCSATPTTPSAAGRSRCTTSSTTPRSSAPRRSARSTLPDTGYSRGLFLVLARRVRRVRRALRLRLSGGTRGRSRRGTIGLVSSDDKVVGRQDDLPLNAVLAQRPRAVDLRRAPARRSPGLGQRRLHPAHRLPARRGARPQLPVPAGRGHRPDRGGAHPDRDGRGPRGRRPCIRNYRRDGSPFWNQVVISPVRRRDRPGHPPRRDPGRRDRPGRRRTGSATWSSTWSEQTTARLELLARISDELARHLEYDDAVDALGDIAIPALATWGFVAITDDRGRFARVHLVAGDPHDRDDRARAGQRGRRAGSSRAPKIAEALHSSPGFVATPYAIDVAGLPARTTPAQLAPAAPARPGQRDGRAAAGPRPRARRADASSPSTGSPPTRSSPPPTSGVVRAWRWTTSGCSSPSAPPR